MHSDFYCFPFSNVFTTYMQCLGPPFFTASVGVSGTALSLLLGVQYRSVNCFGDVIHIWENRVILACTFFQYTFQYHSQYYCLNTMYYIHNNVLQQNNRKDIIEKQQMCAFVAGMILINLQVWDSPRTNLRNRVCLFKLFIENAFVLPKSRHVCGCRTPLCGARWWLIPRTGSIFSWASISLFRRQVTCYRSRLN